MKTPLGEYGCLREAFCSKRVISKLNQQWTVYPQGRLTWLRGEEVARLYPIEPGLMRDSYGGWWFCDQQRAVACGPYSSRDEALAGLGGY